MQIEFVRSGGFAGAATNVEGTVTFDAGGGRVHSDRVQYSRELEPEEARQLRAAAESADASRAKSGARTGPGPTRDAYQYDVTLTTDDGKKVKLAAPSGGLLDWVQAETKRIWAFRAGARSSGSG